MKWFGVFIAVIFLSSCGDSWIKKPEGLIPEKQMVDIIIDLHLASTLHDQKENRISAGSMKITQNDFYYSVLKKHQVVDSVFEKSIIYYSSFPKDFEKIYASALDKVSRMREEYGEEEQKPVDIGNRGAR